MTDSHARVNRVRDVLEIDEQRRELLVSMIRADIARTSEVLSKPQAPTTTILGVLQKRTWQERQTLFDMLEELEAAR
jgi:hypothetical protein